MPSKEDNQLLEALWRQGDERIASATTCFNALEVIANTSTTSNEKVMDINVISKMERRESTKWEIAASAQVPKRPSSSSASSLRMSHSPRAAAFLHRIN